jgi:HD-like signal output (HDOD) protein
MSDFASLQDVVEATRAIPCAPALLPRLLAMTQSGDSDTREMESLILTDPGLATGVLRLANSAYFASSHRCESVAEAILRLGSATLYRLAATAVAGRWLAYSAQKSGYGWQAGDLCRHSLCVAISAETLAMRMRITAPETAYTAGLLHDVGKLALSLSNERALAEIADLVPLSQSVWREAETSVLGYSSTDVTRELLRKWGFSDALVAVGEFYPRPSQAPLEHRALVTLIHAAKNVGLELGFGVGAEGFYAEPDEIVLQEYGFDETSLNEVVPEILERVQRFIEPDGRLKGIQGRRSPAISHPILPRL